MNLGEKVNLNFKFCENRIVSLENDMQKAKNLQGTRVSCTKSLLFDC